jgi:hypothetical protein
VDLPAATPTEQAEPARTPCRPLPSGRPTGGLADGFVNRVFRLAVALHPLDQHAQVVMFAIGNL